MRASPLPAALASALGDSPDVVKRAVEGVAAEAAEGTGAGALPQGAEEGVAGSTEGAQGVGGEGADGLEFRAGVSGLANGVADGSASGGIVVDRQAGAGAGVVAAHREGRGAAAEASGGGSRGGSELEALRGKVQAVVQEAGPKVEAMVARAWQLGPRGMGPCMLLTPQAPAEGQAGRVLTPGGAAPAVCGTQGAGVGGLGAQGATACGSLFDPAFAPGVVRVGRQGVVTAAGPGAGDPLQLPQPHGVAQEGQHQPPHHHQQQHHHQHQHQQHQQQCVVDLRLGWPLAATALGVLEPGTAAAARHWGSGGAAAVASGQLPTSWEPVAAAVESGGWPRN